MITTSFSVLQILLISSANKTHDESSKRGIEIFLIGATLHFDATIREVEDPFLEIA